MAIIRSEQAIIFSLWLVFLLVVLADEVKIHPCFQPFMSPRAQKCVDRFAESRAWRDRLRGINVRMQGRTRSGSNCLQTVYGDSDGSNCLDSTLFPLLFLCWNDREPLMKQVFTDAGARTRHHVVQGAQKLRECLLEDGDTD
ncbi:hypothetical protein MRX96_030523 [Rhipicephalus microplus]|uniref:uncharacterized protein LOC142814040 n=1 Tax=Rhipicephalus microplus TaxID=6941 RepID=UPI002376B5FD